MIKIWILTQYLITHSFFNNQTNISRFKRTTKKFANILIKKYAYVKPA